MGVTPHSYWGCVVVFIAGVLIGAFGQYFAQLGTDRRRPREARNAAEDAGAARRQSILTLGPTVVQQLRPILEQNPTIREFVTIPNNNVMIGGVIRLVEDKMPGVTWRRICAVGGLAECRIHDLRHTFGVHAARSGVPLVRLQRLMGHSTPTMTLRYMRHPPDGDFASDATRVADSMNPARLDESTRARLVRSHIRRA